MLFSLTWPPYVCKGVLLLVAHAKCIRSSIQVSQSGSGIITQLHSISNLQSISAWVKIFCQSIYSPYISLYSLSTHSIHSILVTKFYERMVIITPIKLIMLDEHSANLFCSISSTCDVSSDKVYRYRKRFQSLVLF